MYMIFSVCNMLLIAGIWFAIAKKSVVNNMEKYGIVPDLIPQAPKDVAEVKYGDLAVNMGNELTPTQVKDPPTVLKWNTKPEAYYALLFVDPDVFPILNVKQLLIWFVINIPGNDITKGDIIFDYLGSGPPKGSGYHRDTFLIYKQPGKREKLSISYITDSTFLDRGKYSVADIVKSFNLGDPIAGNFFKTQYDDYVPELHKKTAKRYKKE